LDCRRHRPAALQAAQLTCQRRWSLGRLAVLTSRRPFRAARASRFEPAYFVGAR
jgi:hypothetical protein